MFGPHLTIDLYGCNERKICNKKFIYNVLNELPDIIGMHKISKPYIKVYSGKKGSFDKGGISSFILIAESHISIHTFKGYSFASVDIFSCKEFEVEKAEEYLVKKFEAKKVERNFIVRGKEFKKL
ncbi:MAG: adenosylmethionine decarboxylase [Candidatus Aenigmatarchaeota archaeon]